jgi:hypothetical protein
MQFMSTDVLLNVFAWARRFVPLPTLRLLLFALAFVSCAGADGSNAAGVGSNAEDSQAVTSAGVNPADAKAAACARTLEQFILELDAVLTENPRSSLRYDAVLAKYLFLNNGVRGLPLPAPDASVEGCNINQVIEIAKQSKFFYEANGPPRYQHYGIEFRNSAAKVSFAIHKVTGNIFGPNTNWIRVYP